MELKQNNFLYLSPQRFNAIYQLSKLDLPSWEIIGENVFGQPISETEFLFVIKNTRRNN